MEGIQDRKSTERQRQDERICDQDPQAPGRTGNKCCFIPEHRHPVAVWILSFFLFSCLIFQHRTSHNRSADDSYHEDRPFSVSPICILCYLYSLYLCIRVVCI